jgi:peptide chain release factor 3
MDPRHRDSIAFVRILSGRFTAAWKSPSAHWEEDSPVWRRSSSWPANARRVEEAWPRRDRVIDRGTLRIGDTLAEEGIRVHGIPLSPEHFARVVLSTR